MTRAWNSGNTTPDAGQYREESGQDARQYHQVVHGIGRRAVSAFASPDHEKGDFVNQPDADPKMRLLAWAEAHPARAFGAFLALALILTHPGVFFGSKALFFRDYGVLGYGFVHHYRESILAGELPLWNPYSDCGAPFLAQWGTMVLYPLSLLMVVLPMPWSLGFFCLLHLWIAGMGMRKLAADLRLGGFACALAGTLYVFNGATLSGLMWPNYAVVLGWLPWVLWSVRKAWTLGGKWVLGAAVIATLQMLSGVPELILFTWFTALVWVMGDWWLHGRVMKYFGRFAGVIALVTGLSAAQLLPFLQTLDLSYRTPGFSTNNWSIPLWGWVNLFLPMIRQIMTYQGTFYQEGQQFISTYYCGAAVLVLAVFGVVKSERRIRWVWAGIALLGLILAMGGNLPGYEAVRKMIPVWSLIRFPVKFIYLAVPALILLAAFGWQALASGRAGDALRESRRFGWIIGSVAGLMLLTVGVAWVCRHGYDNWQVIRSNTLIRFFVFAGALTLLRFILLESEVMKRRLAQLAVLSLFIGDACLHYPKLNPTLPARVFEANVVREHQQLPKVTAENFYRVFISSKAEDMMLMSTVPEFEQEFFGRRLALWSNLNLLDSTPKVNGSSTLPLKWQKELEDKIYAMTNTPPPAALLDFLGARYETSPKSAVEWVARTNAMKLVTAGQQIIVEADEKKALAGVLAEDFNPRETVWLSQPVSSPDPVQCLQASVSNLLVKSHEITFQAYAEKTTVAVIAQSWHPSMRAYVNDMPAQVMRANHAFQAVVIPQGHSTVRIYYHDFRFGWGRALSALTVLVMLVLAWNFRRVQTSSQNSPP
ncbi:MAG TPA: YfhO family protein [Verrucomicrobiae bacterium]